MKAVFTILIIFLISASGFATTCTNKANDEIYKELVRDSQVIFLGRAISIGESDGISTPVIFQVLKGWKGVDSDKITVNFIHDGTVSNSLLLPETDSSEIIYADRNITGKVFSSYCHQVKNSEERLKKELGEGKVYEHLQPEKPIDSSNTSESFLSKLWQNIVCFFS